MPAPAPTRPTLLGIGLMTAAMALFAVEDMFLKFSAEGLPTGEILAVTALFGLLFFGGMAWREGRQLWHVTFLQPLVIARNVSEVVGSFAYITAIATVPLPSIAAVLQATPLVVTLGAALFMGEQVGWRRWSAIAVGFAGVMLVIRPGIGEFHPAILWVIVSVIGLSVRDLCSRAMPQGIATSQLTSWGAGAVGLLGAAMIPFQGWVTPSAPQSLMLLGAMAFGTAGYWAITAGTRMGEASVVAPFRYARLVFVMVISLVVFAEYPDRLTQIGAALIIASGLYAFARESFRKSSRAKPGLYTVTNQG